MGGGGDVGSIGVEGKRLCPIGEEEEEAGARPTDPEDIESQMKPFLQQAVAIGVQEVLEEKDKAEEAGNEQDGTDKVGHLFCRSFTHDI
jgi:hypothetical protein